MASSKINFVQGKKIENKKEILIGYTSIVFSGSRVTSYIPILHMWCHDMLDHLPLGKLENLFEKIKLSDPPFRAVKIFLLYDCLMIASSHELHRHFTVAHLMAAPN